MHEMQTTCKCVSIDKSEHLSARKLLLEFIIDDFDCDAW